MIKIIAIIYLILVAVFTLYLIIDAIKIDKELSKTNKKYIEYLDKKLEKLKEEK